LAVVVNNTDLNSVALTVLPPNDKKLGWTLCDPCGKKDAKSYTKVFNASNKPQSGDLAAWVGKNPKGLWNLKAKDTKFCVPQAPGNAQLCNTKDKTDGEILTWSIQIQTLSSKKVAAEGTLLAKGGLVLQKANTDPSACNETLAGYIYFNTKLKSLSVCDGKDWIPVVLSPLGSPQNPGLHCKDIFVKRPGATDGNYWIDPDGSGPVGVFQVFCDMQGGGWTRLDESTNFGNQVYSESSKYYNFTYSASTSQIEALKKVSSNAKQSWSCASKGVGSQNYYRGWDGKTYTQSGSGTCWHNNNSSIVNGKGEHTSFAQIPLKAWQSVDCGDSSEYCSYNVGPAWLK